MFRLSYKTFVKTIGDKGCHTGLFMGSRDQRLTITSNTKSMISTTLLFRNDKNSQYIDENMQKYCRIRRLFQSLWLVLNNLNIFYLIYVNVNA